MPPAWTEPPPGLSSWQGGERRRRKEPAVVERRLPRWSELREVIRPRRPSGNATARRLARAATIGDLREIARQRVPRAGLRYTHRPPAAGATPPRPRGGGDQPAALA